MKRRILPVALGGSVAMMLAGCALGGPATEGSSGDTDEASITYGSWTPEEGTFDEIVAGFNEENPGIAVESSLAPYDDYLTTLRTELAAGEGPDLFALEPGALLTQFQDFVVPVAELADDPEWAEAYTESAIGGATLDGEVYGLPTGVNSAGLLWVNYTLLTDLGLEVPTDYEELVQVAIALEEAGHVGIAYGGKDDWQNLDYFMTVANGIDSDALYAALEGAESWESEAMVESFTQFKRIFEDEVTQSGATGAATYMDALNLFLEGHAAFFASGSWELGLYSADSSSEQMGQFDSGVIAFPAPGADGSQTTADANSILVVNRASENQAAAFKLAEYMSSGPGAQVLTDFFLDTPPTRGADGPADLSPEAAQTREQITEIQEETYAGYRQLRDLTVKDALAGALSELMLDRISPADAAAQVQEAVDAG